MIIQHYRNMITTESTGGVLVIDGVKFCETLEDVYRGLGAKIYGETCFPPLSLDVSIRYSSKFNRDVVCLHNYMDGNRPVVTDGRIEFDYIYAHGLNTDKGTLGCVGVAYRRLNEDTIQGTAESELLGMVSGAIAAGKNVKWEVIMDLDNIFGFKWEG